MKHFGQKNTLTDIVYSKPMLIVLGVIFLFLAVSVMERYKVAHEMTSRRMATETEKEALLLRKQSLQEKVDYLAGERGLEEEIRTHFDVAREGEKVIILMGETQKVPEDIPAPKKEVWYKFW